MAQIEGFRTGRKARLRSTIAAVDEANPRAGTEARTTFLAPGELRLLIEPGVVLRVLLASHLLNEVEQVCDRVVIIRRGRVVESGRVSDLVRRGGYLEVAVRPDELVPAAQLLQSLPFVQSVSDRDGALAVAGADGRGGEINRFLAGHGIFASALVPRHSSLEDIFLELTEGSTPGEQAAPATGGSNAAPAA